MNSAYQLKPWNQVVTPHSDIIQGNLDMSTYAVSLGAVIRQDPQCPIIYRDARKFFAATYLTAELKKLLVDVSKGLRGESGDRVLQLRTPFGGGKTHALVSLYHLAKHRQEIASCLAMTEGAIAMTEGALAMTEGAIAMTEGAIPDPGLVQVAAFIGLDISASTGIQIENGPRILTPWGYLAWQIGGYDAYSLVETEDKQRIAPGNDTLRQIFGSSAILILIDEFSIYVENAMALTVGDSTFGRQVLTFIQKLTEVVRDLPKTVLVYSLQASVQEAIGNEGLLSTLDKLVSRIDAKKEPVSGDEIMRVVQRRLFADVGNPEIIQEVARQQAELFRKFRENYADTSREKQEVQQQADLLAERIQLSYPFHPDLIDLMYHRWGSLPSYQRTRGALQFLASTIYALRESPDNSWLITPANVPFDNEAVRSAFFTQVGERDSYSAVLASDLLGRKAKVRLVDKRIAQDAPALSQLKVGTRLASAVLMYSFGARGGEDRGVMEQEIIGACLAPGLDRTIITVALSDLREQLLYLHYVGRRYRFETKPNLNKLIADEESKVGGDEVLEKLFQDLGKALQSKRGKVVLWPEDSSRISDRVPNFSIVYLNPSWAEKSPELILVDALTWLENRGNDKREYKNALAFVVPNKLQIEKARKGARTALAIASLLEQKKKYKFTEEDTEELASKAREMASEISAALRHLYDDILLPLPCKDGTAPVKLEHIKFQSQLNTSQNLQERILDALSDRVFDSITPTKLMQLSGLENSQRNYIKGEELISYFFRFPNFPKMLGAEAIEKAILKAVEQGIMGYVPSLTIPADNGMPTVENMGSIVCGRSIPANELDFSGYLLSPNLVTQLRAEKIVSIEKPDLSKDIDSTTQQVGEEKKTIEYKSQTSSISRTVLVDIVNGKLPARHYKLASMADKSKIFQLFEVLQTLSDKAEDLTINIEVRAHTTKEFDLNWIRNAIEEPLDEMDIQATTKLE